MSYINEYLITWRKKLATEKHFAILAVTEARTQLEQAQARFKQDESNLSSFDTEFPGVEGWVSGVTDKPLKRVWPSSPTMDCQYRWNDGTCRNEPQFINGG